MKHSKDGSTKVTDEKVNTITHMVGAIMALTGVVFLIVFASSAWEYVAYSIYGFSLIALFVASTFHHGYNGQRKTNHVLQVFDYCSIFLLIAGTFTPFCLLTFRGKLGWALFGIIWFLAILGISLKASIKKLPKWVTTTLYATLGWLGVFLGIPLFFVNIKAAMFLLAGGMMYTIGAYIFSVERPNPLPGIFGFHELWHIFVILGALLHYVAIVLL